MRFVYLPAADMRLYAMQFYLVFAIIPLQAAHAPRPDVFTAK
jgi:hypothetical protein